MLIKFTFMYFYQCLPQFLTSFSRLASIYAVQSVLKFDKTIKKSLNNLSPGVKKTIMDKTRQRTIYLWSDPRSLSTAFLRAMMMADGCLVVSRLFHTLNINYYGPRLAVVCTV